MEVVKLSKEITGKINNIFLSIDGEVNFIGQGLWSIFVRFAGCQANCSYCDTEYTKGAGVGVDMTVDEVYEKIQKLTEFNGLNKITITGGEPFEQLDFLTELTNKLLQDNFYVSIETNGLHDVSILKRNIDYVVNLGLVVDWKMPSSGNFDRNATSFLIRCFGINDYLKFVIADFRDFCTALQMVERIKIETDRRFTNIFFSPCTGRLSPLTLYKWIKEADETDIGINLQLHKYIFDNVRDEEN